MHPVRQEMSRGMTLIMVAGVLTVLAALGAGFYTCIASSSLTSVRYADSVRASLLARAGINDAIGRLRELAFINTESPTDAWYTVDWRHGATRRISFPGLDKSSGIAQPAGYARTIGNSVALHSDRYQLTINDSASKINVNACDNIGVLLDNLCRVIGAPLVAADLDAVQPRRWFVEGSPGGLFDSAKNVDDTKTTMELYYRPAGIGPPLTSKNGSALYGDGYAIARYRSRVGLFRDISDIKYALTVVAQPGHPELEQLEREVKFAAIRDYLTVDSWVDTNTVCVGKFEWCKDALTLIDRDKSWVADDPTDVPNHRGSLRGSYVSIVNGHGAGQLRRIATNGIDWIKVDQPFVVLPGPISSYMIIAREDAKIDSDGDPEVDAKGNLIDDPAIDYKRFPLCIHRAPVSVNTASDKVLAALFLGINVQHGTPLGLGTDSDAIQTAKIWSTDDPLRLFGRIPTLAGLKRSPINSGKPVLDRPEPWPVKEAGNFNYIDNRGALGTPEYLRNQNGVCNEAHELAYRIISARQRSVDAKTGLPVKTSDPDPTTADPETAFKGYERGPFKSWDDLYFRVVKPWDDIRSYDTLPDPALPGRTTIPNSGGLTKGLAKASLAAMIMAHFNSNTDILKFNPNIEWIDRWGRNFTSMEPVMAFTAQGVPAKATGLLTGPTPPGAPSGSFYFIRNMRYRIEEMIDKTDLNRSTTEFALDSGGIFEITSVGQVVKNGEVRAERKAEALVQVYDVWRESTQRQFVQGTISNAANQAAHWKRGLLGNASGTVARDGSNDGKSRRALTTLPEPLVPISYRLKNNVGGKLLECVDDVPRDARGNPKDYSLPDVLANKILPAIYDGQIVLATNVCSFDPTNKDTFLASFNGDLDTDTCIGNGREQAKTPENSKIRVCDTISLLGLLNDTEIDIDPYSYPVFGINISLGGAGVTNPLGPLSNDNYAANVTCRMGDLRPDGVCCGTLGTSCKDATLKYPYGSGPASDHKDGSGPAEKLTYQNYDPRLTTIGMWFKPLWHANDHMEHEFFNGSSNGAGWMSRGNKLTKNGYVQGGNGIGWPMPDGTLWTVSEDYNDRDMTMCLHSGTDLVPAGNLPPAVLTETPSFHTQPFRWGYIGAMFRYNHTTSNPSLYTIYGGTEYGFWHDPPPRSVPPIDPTKEMSSNVMRPYISTYRYPEGPNYKTDSMWVLVNDCYGFSGCDLDGQPAAYPWEKSNNPRSKEGCFTMNNTNEGMVNGTFLNVYRQQPNDTAYSVIDEWKITNRNLSSIELGEIMTTSRYYLPASTTDVSQLPTFTSQSLVQSTNGSNAQGSESVVLARVNWNVFTPRFMHEYKKQGTYSHQEVIKGKQATVATFGPFDYAQYNADIDWDHDVGWKSLKLNPRNAFLGVNRPAPKPGVQSHYSKGVEIELLNKDVPVAGYEDSTGAFVSTSTFKDPDVVNSFYDPRKPLKLAIVPISDLRYRVRFKYPIYSDADPLAGSATVNPATQFLLDTPVFDDISIIYMSTPRMVYFHEVSE